ncbi:MAG: nitrous oxide reductase family maturation protein NosD [Pyrobaculum sp.]
MALLGLLLLAGIIAVKALAAVVIIDKPGVYENITASRLVINASDVVLKNAVVKGGEVAVELPAVMTAYRLKPTAGCMLIVGRNITVERLELWCSSGVLVFNSTNVAIRGINAVGLEGLPIYKRGVGLYLYNSSNVEAAWASFRHFHDCIYVEYSRGVKISNVETWDCRYGVHLMFSHGAAIEGLYARQNYVGAALMYTTAATLQNATLVDNRNWAEGYGLLLAEVEGEVAGCTSRGNIHGVFVLYWGGTRVVVKNCDIVENYFGVTLWGRNGTGVLFANNTIRDNVVAVLHRGVGEAAATAAFIHNLWGGHPSDRPYVYSSAFSDLMTATEGDLAFLAASPAKALIDSLAGRPVVADPTPQPDVRQPSWLAVFALLPAALWIFTRR